MPLIGFGDFSRLFLFYRIQPPCPSGRSGTKGESRFLCPARLSGRTVREEVSGINCPEQCVRVGVSGASFADADAGFSNIPINIIKYYQILLNSRVYSRLRWQ